MMQHPATSDHAIARTNSHRYATCYKIQALLNARDVHYTIYSLRTSMTTGTLRSIQLEERKHNVVSICALPMLPMALLFPVFLCIHKKHIGFEFAFEYTRTRVIYAKNKL